MPGVLALRCAITACRSSRLLPLTRSEMPTGLSWRDDGTLAFCSLKGGVGLVKDTDGDGVEDRVQMVADGLAAPYGLACREDAIEHTLGMPVRGVDHDDVHARLDQPVDASFGFRSGADVPVCGPASWPVRAGG